MDLFDIAVARKLSGGGGGGGGGDSDFSTATMTVIGSPSIRMSTILDVPSYGLTGSYYSNAELDSPYTVILYKGKAYLEIRGEVTSISGSASIDSMTGMLVVTGDCTITTSEE